MHIYICSVNIGLCWNKPDPFPQGLVIRVSCVYLGLFNNNNNNNKQTYKAVASEALSVPQPSDWLERLVTEMTYCMLSGTLNSTHSESCLCYVVLQECKVVLCSLRYSLVSVINKQLACSAVTGA